MSEFVEVEWFGRDHKIGIVLTYDQYAGFKARMAPLPEFLTNAGEMLGIQWIMDNAAKIPFEWAWGIFGARMETEWMYRNLTKEWQTVRYDSRDYNIKTLEQVK